MKNAIKAKLRKTPIYKFAGKGIYSLRNNLFDFKYGVETARDVELKNLRIDSPHAKSGMMYLGTHPKSFASIRELENRL